MESHFLAPQQLFPTETAAWPITPTQVKPLGGRLVLDPKTSIQPRDAHSPQVKSRSLAGTTPPLQHRLRAWQHRSLPKARARARAGRSLSLLRPSLSPRASRSITAASRPSCLQATATRACLIMPGCRALCPALLPSSTAPPCLFLQGGQDQLQPNNIAWDWVWQTPRLVPSSSRRSSSPTLTVSTPSAQVSQPVPNIRNLLLQLLGLRFLGFFFI